MNQEDKELLLKDLCSRLPYGVKAKSQISHLEINTIDGYFVDGDGRKMFHLSEPDFWQTIDGFQYYLRPMSSMTEEEKKEMHEKLSPTGTAIYKEEGISIPLNHYGEWIPYEYMSRIINYLIAHHFDYRGLIPKGLAVAVTEENNPYKG